VGRINEDVKFATSCWFSGRFSGGPVTTCKSRFLELSRFDVLLDQLGCHTNDVLAFPVLDHVHRLQSGDYVALCDARHVAVES
jgi:hypothetical protein